MKKTLAHLVIAGFALLLNTTVSWGGPPNPTASDTNNNTAGGTDVLLNVTEAGADNTAFGAFALFSNTSGSFNTASGYEALSGNTTGSDNTAIGGAALHLNRAGSSNTAVGVGALFHSTGSHNIAIGEGAGTNLVGGNKNIYLYHPGVEGDNKTMRLGHGQNKSFIAGVATSAVIGSTVVIDPEGRLGTQLSSARYKRDIETMGAQSQGLLKLRPVSFVYARDAEGTRQYGLIAEEVATIYPELVTRGKNGDVQAVRYQELIPMLVNELQRQQRELAELRELVDRLRGGIIAGR